MPQDPAMLEAELRARIAHAPGPFDEAVWRLAVGDAEASLSAIRAALPGLAAQASSDIQVAHLALVARDLDAARVAADAALQEAVARFVPGNREYHAVILSLIADDETRAATEEAALDAFVATHSSFRGGQPAAVADIARGLMARDSAVLATGIDALLAWHLRRARARSDLFNSSRGVVALDAVVAMILGWQRGLPVDVAGTYRAARVPLLALHVTEWEGRPLPRGLALDHVTDLIAGPWLRAAGIPVEGPVAPRATSTTPSRRRAVGTKTVSSGAEARAAREGIARRLAQGGSAWQLASWALMLNDVDGARRHLMAKAADARRAWEASTLAPGGGLRWFRKDEAPPNQNLVREHFALALALHDEEGLRDTAAHLRAWLTTQEHRVPSVYGHAAGYLDLICDVLSGERTRLARPAIDQVMGPYSSTRVAAVALVARDRAGLRQGLEDMLEEHAKQIERKSSPSSPICPAALEIAVAADRLGMEVAVDERYRTWPVPVEGGRIACDLLGRAIWADRG